MGTNVALIGAGAMGGAIGTRLCETGHRLAVFDPRRGQGRGSRRPRRGAAGSAPEAASRSDVVITSLNAAGIVEAAVFGPKGVAEGAKLHPSSGAFIIS
jgi:2-hydroxy-3-oxopropionate reductase